MRPLLVTLALAALQVGCQGPLGSQSQFDFVALYTDEDGRHLVQMRADGTLKDVPVPPSNSDYDLWAVGASGNTGFVADYGTPDVIAVDLDTGALSRISGHDWTYVQDVLPLPDGSLVVSVDERVDRVDPETGSLIGALVDPNSCWVPTGPGANDTVVTVDMWDFVVDRWDGVDTREEVQTLQSLPMAVAEATDGALWIVDSSTDWRSGSRVVRYFEGTEAVLPIDTAANFVFGLVPTGEGKMLVGVSAGEGTEAQILNVAPDGAHEVALELHDAALLDIGPVAR